MSIPNIRAFVDFTSPFRLEDLATQISQSIFGGIPFSGLNTGIWDEVPAVRLDKPVLGLEVILGGAEGDDSGYTLEILALDYPWDLAKDELPDLDSRERSLSVACDISEWIGHELSQIPGIVLQDAQY